MIISATLNKNELLSFQKLTEVEEIHSSFHRIHIKKYSKAHGYLLYIASHKKNVYVMLTFETKEDEKIHNILLSEAISKLSHETNIDITLANCCILFTN